MRKLIYIGLVIEVCVGLLALYSGISHANPAFGITGSKHDLSSTGGGSNFQFETSETCVFCHTPHGGSTVVREKTYIWNTSGSDYQGTDEATGGQPLLMWNRALANAGSATGVRYRLYKSSTLDSESGKIRVYSLLCMSCHDGVGSLNVLYNYPHDEWWVEMGEAEPLTVASGYDQIGDESYPLVSSPNIGERDPDSDSKIIDLSNDHPISIDYTQNLALNVDQGLKDPTSAIDPAIRLFPTETSGACNFYPTTGGTPCVSLECSSCHNPHNEGSDAAGTSPFLVKTKNDSAICTACHNK